MASWTDSKFQYPQRVSPRRHVIFFIDHMPTCIFTFYGYIMNSQRHQPLVRALHRYRRGPGFELPRLSLVFLQFNLTAAQAVYI